MNSIPKNIFFLSIFVSMFSLNAFAGQASGWELEVDPIAFALKGYSAHVGPRIGSWKFDINTASEDFTSDQTKTLLSQTNFMAKFVSYGAKVDYIGETGRGWHVGLQYDSSNWTYTSTINNQTATNIVQDIGLRIGYRFTRGNFYVDPWIAVLKNISGTNAVSVGGQTFQPQKVLVFPTVHVGFKF
jgi:hypothetical protein